MTGNEDRIIACVGLGFVGLRTALSFGENGHPVIGIDVDESRIEHIQNGTSPIHGEEFDSRLERQVRDGRIRATAKFDEAASEADVFVVSVPTPVTNTGESDFSHLLAAGEEIGDVLREGDLVVIQSTVPPMTCKDVFLPELERSGLEGDKDFGLAHVPERYAPGDDQSLQAPRLVAATSARWQQEAAELYRSLGNDIVSVSSIEVAEGSKILENLQRDVNIALVNEVAKIFDEMGINVWQTLDAAETKWNFHRYDPGIGVGGHCIPVDPYHLIDATEDLQTEAKLVQSARLVNESMPSFHFRKLRGALKSVGKSVEESVIAINGVTYKPGVQDLRNSPALALLETLSSMAADVRVYDPGIRPTEEIAGTSLINHESLSDAATNADALVLSFDAGEPVDVDRLATVMNLEPVVVDITETVDSQTAEDSGFVYQGFGQSSATGSRIDSPTMLDSTNE